MTSSKPYFWGYDTGRRTLEVRCSCGKVAFDSLAYEHHMMAKHPDRVRKMKKDGRWQQDRLEGWSGARL
jgi:hypothetical protein